MSHALLCFALQWRPEKVVASKGLGPRVHSVWVRQNVFHVAFKFWRRTDVRLEFLAYSGLYIYICWCWRMDGKLGKATWRDNYGFL